MILELQQIGKTFGTQTALQDISLSTRESEFVAVVGPSGCGKTTLLRLVAGLENCDQGTISIKGRSVQNLPPRDRGVSMVFQGESLYPHMTVKQNLEFPLTVRRNLRTSGPRANIGAAVQSVAEQFEITELLDRSPGSLSGGQRQRVALARSLVREPEVLLLDEPFSHLDTHLRRQMGVELSELRKGWLATTLFVTHDIAEAERLADRIVVLNQGVIEQVGTAAEIRQQPESDFVRQFCGLS